jgi:hypothetical protein
MNNRKMNKSDHCGKNPCNCENNAARDLIEDIAEDVIDGLNFDGRTIKDFSPGVFLLNEDNWTFVPILFKDHSEDCRNEIAVIAKQSAKEISANAAVVTSLTAEDHNNLTLKFYLEREGSITLVTCPLIKVNRKYVMSSVTPETMPIKDFKMKSPIFRVLPHNQNDRKNLM